MLWESGLACIAIASVCSSLGALCIKILAGRVPVFEIVVCAVVCLCLPLSNALLQTLKRILHSHFTTSESDHDGTVYTKRHKLGID